MSSISSKKKNDGTRLYYYDNSSWLVFVRFLEEIEDSKKLFRNYLTFNSFAIFKVVVQLRLNVQNIPEKKNNQQWLYLIFLSSRPPPSEDNYDKNVADYGALIHTLLQRELSKTSSCFFLLILFSKRIDREWEK